MNKEPIHVVIIRKLKEEYLHHLQQNLSDSVTLHFWGEDFSAESISVMVSGHSDRSVLEKLPNTRVKIFYIDLRVSGRNEDFLEKVKQEKNIELIKGKVGRVNLNSENGKLELEAEDIENGIKLTHVTDIVILATGIVPNKPLPGLPTSPEGFLNGQQEGILAVSCSTNPMDVSTSVKDATAAALKAIQN